MCNIHTAADAPAAPTLDPIDNIHTAADAQAAPTPGLIDIVHQEPSQKLEGPFPEKGPPGVLPHTARAWLIDHTIQGRHLPGLRMGLRQWLQTLVLYRP